MMAGTGGRWHHDPREGFGGGRGRHRGEPFMEGDLRRFVREALGARMRGMRVGRVPRGNVRAAILLLLAEEPRNGYQIMQEIGERSRGVWSPSPGSVYPAVQQLEDEGLVVAQESEGQRLLRLTDTGRAHVDDHRDELGSPWDEMSGSVGDDVHELFSLMRQVAGALVQVAHAGNPAYVVKAAELLRQTKRGLYRILAEDETEA